MARRVALPLIFVVFPALFAATPRTYVLETGLYESIVIDDGEVWLGVFPSGSYAQIRQCKIRVRKVESEYASEGTAMKVEATSGKEPLFMVKGAASVKPGNVMSLYTMSADVPATVTVAIHDKKYVINTVEEQRADGFRVRRLKLKLGRSQMILGECLARDSIFPVWAGDLDGDGRIDVYLRIEHHNYWVEQLLFLSSGDPTGKALTTRSAKLLIRKLE